MPEGSLRDLLGKDKFDCDTTSHNPVAVFSKCVGKWEVKPEDFTLINKIGEGAMGVIFKAKLRGQTVAAKKLKDRRKDQNKQAYKDLVTELDVLVSIGQHPNLVQFQGACLYDSENPIIFEEFVQGPSLEAFFTDKMKLSKGTYCPPRTAQFAWIMDMMRALDFLHNRDPIIIHRDMKPGNLLLTADLTTLKITDFGMAKAVKADLMETAKHTGYTGTVRYMAPEVFSCVKGHYTEKADIYSAAIIMWYISTGQRPMLHGKHDLIWRPDTNLVEWVELRDVMRRAWDGEPGKRPSAVDLVREIATLPGRPTAEVVESDFAPKSSCAGGCSVM